MQPLVSICIPTYNRAECLKQTLDSIVIQTEFIDGRVDVVISDNASTDNTKSLCKSYLGRYTGIHYYCNDENIRDRNFPTVLSKATGKLRKLNNDTAILEPGSLTYLCEMEQKYENSRPLLFFSNGNRVKYTGTEDNVFTFQSFVKKTSYWVTWIASFSIWEDECVDICKNYKCCELLLWQVGKIYEIGSRIDAVAVCPRKIIHSIAPQKKNISYGIYKVFYENYLSIIDVYVKNGSISSDVRDYLEKDLFINFFPEWIVKWELNDSKLQYSENENLKEMVFNQCRNKPYWRLFLNVYNYRKAKAKIKIIIEKLKEYI